MSTCGSCKHWHPLAVHAMNIGAQRKGECREGPPTATSIAHQSAGGVGVIIATAYPQMAANFAACSHFCQAEGRPVPSLAGNVYDSQPKEDECQR